MILFKKAQKMQNMSFPRGKMNQNLIFESKKKFKIWHVEEFLFQNLTRSIFFNPKSDAL